MAKQRCTSEIDTLFAHFDTIVAGLKKTDLAVVFGCKKAGEPGFLSKMCLYGVTKSKNKISVWGIVNSSKDVAEELLLLKSNVSPSMFKEGLLFPEDWPKLSDSFEILQKSNIAFAEKSELSFDDFLNRVKETAAKNSPDLLFILYPIENGHEDITSKTKQLKKISKKLNAPILFAVEVPDSSFGSFVFIQN